MTMLWSVDHAWWNAPMCFLEDGNHMTSTVEEFSCFSIDPGLDMLMAYPICPFWFGQQFICVLLASSTLCNVVDLFRFAGNVAEAIVCCWSADCSGPRIILTYPRGYPHHIGQTVGEVYAFGKGDISWLCSFTVQSHQIDPSMSSVASSCSISMHSLKPTPTTSTTPKPLVPTQHQKTSFQGLSLSDAKRVFSIVVTKRSSLAVRRKGRGGLEISARTASKNIEVEVDKPLGLTLGQKQAGGVVITAVESGGNAAKAGLKAGDQVLYTSSFFGDELWPADKLGFTKTAIQAKPDSVYFVVSRGAEVDVKRLPKRPAPPRFGRKLSEAQKARATHICLDCGFIYTLQKPFDEQPDSYTCPQCRAPKKRFAGYDGSEPCLCMAFSDKRSDSLFWKFCGTVFYAPDVSDEMLHEEKHIVQCRCNRPIYNGMQAPSLHVLKSANHSYKLLISYLWLCPYLPGLRAKLGHWPEYSCPKGIVMKDFIREFMGSTHPINAILTTSEYVELNQRQFRVMFTMKSPVGSIDSKYQPEPDPVNDMLNPNPNALLVPQFLKTREKPSSLSSSYTDVVQFARVTVRNGRAGQQPVAFGSISDNQSLDRGNMWTESTEQRVVCVGGGRYDGLLRLYHPIAIAAYDILCE
ncbi:hypothetical protein MRB53_027241 [Persea americana]|uniref:Uncharacterized protein n=1 Tax=Persea americana TaxID=3435 RepID=A0ACC2LKU8_PERAE|nr:hypothetical protein MRB53_027241 [Persea americana]